MNKKDAIDYALDTMKKNGADKSACSLQMSEKKELNVEIGEMTLLRTTYNTNLSLSVIKDQKKGSTIINKLDKESIKEAIELVMEMAQGSQSDESYDISSLQPSQTFKKGDESANLDIMYNSLEEFVDHVKSNYPKIQLEAAIMDFNSSQSFFKNSNGVDFEIKEGIYGFSPMFL